MRFENLSIQKSETNLIFHKGCRDKMKYSFIIPMYNEETDIKETVLRCLEQKKEQFELEIILIDDGSTDGTYHLCMKLFANKSPVKILHIETNKGVSHARNMGVRYASGEVVIFLNADELIESNFLTKIHQHYSTNADYVFPQTRVANCDTVYGNYRDCYRLTKYASPHLFMWSQGFSCRKELFEEIGGFSEEYPGCGGEDWDFVSKLDLLNKNRVVDLNIVVKHTVPQGMNSVMWHMYNRGRGSAYYDINCCHKSPIIYIIKCILLLSFYLLIVAWDFNAAIIIFIIHVYPIVLQGIKISKIGNNKIGIVIIYLIDCFIRNIGYNLNMLKHCRRL